MVSARMEPSGRSSPSDLIDFLTDLERRDVACETGGAGAPLTPSEIPQTETVSLLPFLGLEELDLLQGSLEGIGGSRPDLPPFSPPAPSYVEESHSASEDLELVPPRRGASQRPPENPKSPDKSSSDATKALFWASILQAQMCVLDLQGEIDRQKEPMRSSSLSPEKVLGTPPSQDSATSHEPLLLESDSGEEAEEDSERREEEDEGSLEEEEEEEEVECLFYNNPLFCASPRTISAEGPALLGHLEEKAFREDGDGIPTGGLTSRDCANGLLCQADVATDSRLLPEPDPGGDPPPGPYPSYVPHYRSLSPLVITEGELESASPVAEEKELPPSIVPSLDTPHKAQGFFPDLSPHTLSSSDLDQIAPPDIDLPAQEGLLFSACSTSLVTAFLQEPLERYPAPDPPSPAEISWASSSLQVPAAAAAAEPSRWQEEQKPQAPSCDHALPLCAWAEEPRRTSCLQEEAAAADLHPDSLGGAEGKLEGSTEGLEMPVVDGDGTLEDEDQEEEEEEETATFHPPEEPPSGNGTDVGKEMPPSKEQAEPNGILQANGSAPPADQAAALRLATRLYHLDGFKKSQVASFLRKNNDFSRLVREAYLSFFHFSGQTLDEALRSFLKAFVLTGETQERERILRHFSQRYHSCNPEVCLSPDAVHTLTCAIMLLNTDLHGQNIGRSMTCQAFLTNLDGLNDDDKNFPKDLLKALYHSIRLEKLEWAADDDEEEPPSSATPLSASSQKKANPFLTLSHDPEAKIYRQGLLARKVHAEADGKKTPWGKRGWKMFHTVLKGMVLYFSKDESRPDASASEEPIGVHHALAEKASKYTKRPHVFRLQTADWRIFLFQAPTAAEMSSWVSRINLVAAMFSSPPFPAAVGSQRKFIRPVLPTAPCKNSLEDQHFTHESWMDQVSDDLLEHQRNLPSKRGRGRDLEEYQLKKEYLLYEKHRYETYVRLLEVKLAGEDTEDLEQWEARLGEAGELPAEEGCPSLQKSHSSPSLNVDGLPGGVKVKRNISERRTVRKIIPRRNKHLL